MQSFTVVIVSVGEACGAGVQWTVKSVLVELRRLDEQRTAAVIEAAARRRHGTHLDLAVRLPPCETRVQTWQQIGDTHTHTRLTALCPRLPR